MSLTSASSFATFDTASFAYETAAFLQPIPRLAHGEAVVRITPKYGHRAVTVTLRYFWHGCAEAPTIIVQGGISASRDVCSVGTTAGWWDDLVGSGRAIDLERYRVLSIDWLAAADLDGASAVSSEDQADALAALLDALGIAQAQAFVGASYGAMVGLAFAVAFPQRLGRLVAIAGAHRPHPFASAWRALQRNVVALGQLQCDETHGLSLARQLALLSYRTPEEFDARFDAPATLQAGNARCAAEDWLAHHGAEYARRTPTTAFLRLSESIDLHRIAPQDVRVPTTLVAFAEDRLVPADDLRALAAGIAAEVRLHVLHSRYGHDAFLKESDAIGACLGLAFDAAAEARA